ncbi:MAG: hypothetical protein IJP44_10170 [Bacteroidales bacterium]|nr:hypothetical protein [Bacteroidales bacterium]
MQTKQLSYYLIDLMKSYIKKEDLLSEKSSEIVLQIGTAIDRAKVANQPTAELEYLYETAVWLKGEIEK